MRVCAGLVMAASTAAALPSQRTEQIAFGMQSLPHKLEEGVGHFSEWSRETKKEFLIDWQANKESEWIFVMGNEGGDLDSITAALSWAYHLEHSSANTSLPIKAMALLQTPTDALDLRPENKLALSNSDMSSGHRDLLTIDELPEDPETLSRKIKGIVLVDHPTPLRKWDDAKILSIIDHHTDVGTGPDAHPRIFEKVASCTTLVARQMLDELEQLPEEYHMPHELLQLMLSAIAIDSDGLNPKKSTEEDRRQSERVLKRSHWHKKDLEDIMEDLDKELGDAKKDLADLGLRDLLRRDWKGDLVDTPSPRTPTVSLGFASIPISMDQQIERTEWNELFDWFAVHAAWTAEVGADISICLNKHKVKVPSINKKKKIREIVLVVRDDVRVDDDQADELFRVAYEAIEKDEKLNVKPWHRANELGKRQMVWTHEFEDGGRKYVRPLLEEAVKAWK
ncbi:hypothetical protein LTR37_016199 [Vermiconidia calcicola]|uniref:Uncharacterized protein n=1 Tax=Vermiconidia calcicola TaxID=1690605 RepID=A0ACC3MNG9_9PEZI|nr:hypothetical protein LTR37_016199 [Vermiconidia calcicola]